MIDPLSIGDYIKNGGYQALRKVLKTNTMYEMEKDRYYVIKRIGTDTTSTVTVEVDGIPVAQIFSTIAPIARTSTNLLTPLDLGEYFIVVPPERKLYFRSSASANVYIEGDLVVLSPGESFHLNTSLDTIHILPGKCSL